MKSDNSIKYKELSVHNAGIVMSLSHDLMCQQQQSSCLSSSGLETPCPRVAHALNAHTGDSRPEHQMCMSKGRHGAGQEHTSCFLALLAVLVLSPVCSSDAFALRPLCMCHTSTFTTSAHDLLRC